jgi:hypothetical protein
MCMYISTQEEEEKTRIPTRDKTKNLVRYIKKMTSIHSPISDWLTIDAWKREKKWEKDMIWFLLISMCSESESNKKKNHQMYMTTVSEHGYGVNWPLFIQYGDKS